MKRKSWIVIALSLLMLAWFSCTAFAESGTCGKNVKWTLSDGVLTISGTGEMYDYETNGPFHNMGVSSIIISKGITSIGNCAFQDCGMPTSITIPDGVKRIGIYAFGFMSSLKSISIPESVTVIDGEAFYACTELENITIPSNVMAIGAAAFYDCQSLKNITLPNTLTSIYGYTFYNCVNMTSILIPETVTRIDDHAFDNCNRLTIYCYENSTAHKYAKANNIKYSLLHEWNEPTYSWSNDNSKVTARRVAKDDPSVIEEETVYSTNTVTKEPRRETYNGKTHLIYGERTYVAVFSNPAFSKQEKTVEAKDIHMKDSDGDGLLDFWEMFGFDYDGDGIVDVDLLRMGADKDIPDLFVEIDYMKGPNINLYRKDKEGKIYNYPIGFKEVDLKPNPNALKLVRDQFAKPRPEAGFENGIQLHIDAGPDSIMNSKGDTWGSLSKSTDIPYQLVFNIGKHPKYAEWMKYITDNAIFDVARRSVFRHCLYVDIYDLNGRSTGIAYGIPSQYFLVADNYQGLSIFSNTVKEATVFMHELGHTLGLFHGGDEDVNYKPNYLSIMNYLYSIDGLSTKYDSAKVNYSEYELPKLNTYALDEKKGIDPEGLTGNIGICPRWYYAKIQDNMDKKYYSWYFTADNSSQISINYNLKNGIEETPIYFHEVERNWNFEGYGFLLTGSDYHFDQYVSASTNDWKNIELKFDNIGKTVDNAVKNMESNYQIDELSFIEALEGGLLGVPSECRIDNVSPITLYANTKEQFVYIDIQNMFPTTTTVHLSIISEVLSEPYSNTILLNPVEQKKIIVEL